MLKMIIAIRRLATHDFRAPSKRAHSLASSGGSHGNWKREEKETV
jgi:hypothetical protein